MLKVLIADKSSLLCELVSERLENEFAVKTCNSGCMALNLLAKFRPEIVVLDVTLADESGVTVLHTLSASNRVPNIIAMTFMCNERALMHLSQYDITCLLSKPCTPDLVVEQIHSIAHRLEHPLETELPIEREIHELLLSLGFRSGVNRYKYVAQGILVRYNNPDCAMKELYIDVARVCGGSYQSVEKAIRDEINRAYDRGNGDAWAYIFNVPKERGKPCHGNREFLACMVSCLRKELHNGRREKVTV